MERSVRSSEKEIAGTGCLAFLPDKFLLPDLVAGHVGGVLAFHDPLECFIVISVKLIRVQHTSFVVDQCVEILGLFADRDSIVDFLH